LTTEGLNKNFEFEFSVYVDDVDLCESAVGFLNFISDYVKSGSKVSAGETIAYGCWITKVEQNDKNELFFSEQLPVTGEYKLGISLTLRLWEEQQELCRNKGAEYIPPLFQQMVAISDGVLEGEATEGVRYPSPRHMSGWWLTTDRYNGDIKTIRTVHLYHVVIVRPDLIKYLGLPFGYRFHASSDQAWFDQKVMT